MGLVHNSFYTISPIATTMAYGVSMQGIEFAKEQGVNLVIALDCGIKAVAEIAYAKEQGIDFLICDHHTPDNVLPDAVAVLDPKRADNSYPLRAFGLWDWL